QPGTLTRVAYQGEPGCYSDHATQKLFELRGASRVDRVPCTTVMAAARLVREGRVDYALLPIENSLVGSVPDTNSVLVQGDLRIADEEVLEIRHVLAAIPGARRENVETVHSHSIALRQCQSLLAESPAPRAVEAHDTAGAARLVAEAGDPSAAALCSEAAALEHGLEVIARDVADADSNMTRFVLVGREEAPPPAGARTKTSLLVTAAHRSGSLAGFLGCLAARGVNLTRIESRPQFDRPWEYLFLVDVEGSAHAEPLQSALEAAREHCSSLRSIGSYPSRTHMPRTVEPSPAAAVTTSPLRVVEYVERRAQASRGEPDEQRRVRPIELGGVEVGGDAFLLIAGPCAVESEVQIHAAAAAVAARGVRLMRAGAFKPRTSPRSFQGHGAQGLRWLREAADAHGLGVVTEVLSTDDLPLLARHADVLQVGARNMQNFELLKALGRADLPVLLKRGMSATLDELLGAVDYVIGGGNQRVVLCERGIRTFETST
ncbi:MAG: prephenate dehydratase domain-containing protein, partial [Planctomycetota bacterium]